MSLINDVERMYRRFFCRIALLLISSVVLPVPVNGEHHLTVAVALPGNTNATAITGSREFSLGNSSSPDVTVLWVNVNQCHPFQIIQLMKELDARAVDLVIHSDDTFRTVENTLGFMVTSPKFVSYLPDEVSEEDQDVPSDCSQDFHFQPYSSPEPDMTCNGTQAMVSQVEALEAVIQKLEWTQILILHDQSHDMEAKDLTDRLSSVASQTQLLMYSLTGLLHDGATSGSGQGRALQDLMGAMYERRMGELRVVVLCSVQCARQVLTAASEFDRRNSKKSAMVLISRWLLVLPPSDRQMLENCDLQLDNVAVIFHPPTTLRPPIKDIEKEMEDILQTAYSKMTEANITLSSAALSEAIRQSLQVPQACYRSEVWTLLWKPEGRRLSDVGHVAHDGQLYMGNGQELFPNIRFGLNRRKFLVATLPWPAFAERTGNGTYRGLCVDLLHQLQVTLNFSYEWTEPEDQEWGSLTKNNTWTGLVGLLQRQEVDMVVAPLAIQAEREMVMDFIYPFFTDYNTVLLKLPDPAETKWKTLIQPFKTEVHMYIWVSLLCVTVITFTVEFVNPYYATNTKAMLHIGDMFWYMFGALLTQGGARLPDSQAGRTMVSAFWLFSIVMAAIYSGNLIAFLTVSKDKPPFNSLRELVEQDQYTWGIIGGTFFTNLFQTTSIDVFRKIWDGIEREIGDDPDVLSGDPLTHLAKVKAGHYAFIGDQSAISTWLKLECNLITIKEQFLPMQYAIGLVNNSAYTHMFSDEMMQINEIGLIETWERKWWSKTSFCKGSLTAEATPIGLIDVQSAFYLVFLGITLALLVLVLEKLGSRFQLGTRIKEAFCKESSSAGRSSSGRTCAGLTLRERSAERSVNGRTLVSEFRHHAGLFYVVSPDAHETFTKRRRGSLGSEFRHKGLFGPSDSYSSDPGDPYSEGRRPLGSEFQHRGLFPLERRPDGSGNARGKGRRPLGIEFHHEGLFQSGNFSLSPRETRSNGSVQVDRDRDGDWEEEGQGHSRSEPGTYFTYLSETGSQDSEGRESRSLGGDSSVEKEASFGVVCFATPNSHESNGGSSRDASSRRTTAPKERTPHGILKKKPYYQEVFFY